MNTRTVGAKQEDVAVKYLLENGMKIVARNFRNRQGEIDIIGYHAGYLVFTEVKYRATQKMGTPAEAVTQNKQRIICRVADYYRCTHGMGEDCATRYDVIAICGEEITWYQNAFEHRGR